MSNSNDNKKEPVEDESSEGDGSSYQNPFERRRRRAVGYGNEQGQGQYPHDIQAPGYGTPFYGSAPGHNPTLDYGLPGLNFPIQAYGTSPAYGPHPSYGHHVHPPSAPGNRLSLATWQQNAFGQPPASSNQGPRGPHPLPPKPPASFNQGYGRSHPIPPRPYTGKPQGVQKPKQKGPAGNPPGSKKIKQDKKVAEFQKRKAEERVVEERRQAEERVAEERRLANEREAALRQTVAEMEAKLRALGDKKAEEQHDEEELPMKKEKEDAT